MARRRLAATAALGLLLVVGAARPFVPPGHDTASWYALSADRLAGAADWRTVIATDLPHALKDSTANPIYRYQRVAYDVAHGPTWDGLMAWRESIPVHCDFVENGRRITETRLVRLTDAQRREAEYEMIPPLQALFSIAVGGAVNYRGRVMAGASTLTPTIAVNDDSQPGTGVFHARVTATGTGVNNGYLEAHWSWSINYTDSESVNAVTHPIWGGTVTLEASQQGPAALFRCHNHSDTELSLTITVTGRIYKGNNEWVTAQDTQVVTVPVWGTALANERYVDSVGGNTANDGYMPASGITLGATGVSYDPATGILSKAGLATAYTQATAVTQRMNRVALLSGTGLTVGHYWITARNSDDAVVIKTGLSGGAISDVALSTGPKATWAECTAHLTATASNRRLWLARGSAYTLDGTNVTSFGLNNDADLHNRHLRTYGTGDIPALTVAASGYTPSSLISMAINETGNAATNLYFENLLFDANLDPTIFANFTRPATDHQLNGVTFAGCTTIDAEFCVFNHKEGGSEGLAIIQNTVTDTVGLWDEAVFASLGAYYSSIGNAISGGGTSTTLHHHEYIDGCNDAQFRWNEYGNSVDRNMCVNANCSNDGATLVRWLFVELDCKGTSRGLDSGNTTNTPSEGTFDQYLIERCRFGAYPDGTGTRGDMFIECLSSCVIRDCWSHKTTETGGLCAFNSGGGAPTTPIVIQQYRNHVYTTGAWRLGFDYQGSAAASGTIYDNEWYSTHTAAIAVSVNFATQLSKFTFSGNRYYAPNDTDAKVWFDGATAKSFAEWQAATGTPDDDGEVADPAWSDPGNGTFHSLLATSADAADTVIEALDGATVNLEPQAFHASVARRIQNVGDGAINVTASAITGDADSAVAPATGQFYPGASRTFSFLAQAGAGQTASLAINTTLLNVGYAYEGAGMSVISMSGLESGSTIELATTSGTVSIDGTTKRTGDYSLRSNPTGTAVGYGRFTGRSGGAQLAYAAATAWHQFYFRIATLPASASEELARANGAGSAQKATMRVTSAGKLQVYAADGTTQVGSDSAATLTTGAWYRIGWKVEGSATGSTIVQVNGVEDITGTGDFTAGDCVTFELGKRTNRNGQTVDFYFDDVVVDSSGFPPAGEIRRMDPVAVGNGTGWAGGTGTTFAEVDDVPHDSDTTYNATSTSGAAQTYDMETWASAGGAADDVVNVVMNFVVAREEPSVTSALQVRLRSATTNNDSSSINMSTTYAGFGQLYATDPATSAAWVTAALDSIEVGAEANAAVEHRMTAAYAFVFASPGVTPDITVEDADTNNIADAGTFDFGTVDQNDVVTEVFTITNDGDGDLTITDITVSGDITLTDDPTSGGPLVLNPTETDIFTITLDTATAGSQSGTVQIESDDPDEDPFNFTVTAEVTAAAGGTGSGSGSGSGGTSITVNLVINLTRPGCF